MKQNSALSIFNKLQKDFNYFLKICRAHNDSNGFEMENIHELRVSIKDIRIYFSVINELQKSPLIKNYTTQFDQIFDIGGNVREFQINLSLVSQNKSKISLQYQAFLEPLLELAENDFSDVLVAFDIQHFKKSSLQVKKSIELLSDSDFHKKVEEMINSKLKKVKKLRSDINNPKKLHRLRMRLKEIAVLMKFMHDFNSGISIDPIYKRFKKLNKLIGNWHDQSVLSISFKEFAGQHRSNDKMRKSLKTIKSKEKKCIHKFIPLLAEIPLNLNEKSESKN